MYEGEDFICITLPKCASRSMMRWAKDLGLQPIHGMHGMSADPKDYEGKLVFVPVRNPYSRALSLWKHLKERYNYRSSVEHLMMEFMGQEEMSVKDIFKYAQIQYMKTRDFPFDEVDVTWVYMENFNEELKNLPIPQENIRIEGATIGNSWSEIGNLSKKEVCLINKWAKDDFEMLNYDKL